MKKQNIPETKRTKRDPDEPAYRRKLMEMVGNILPDSPGEKPGGSSAIGYWKVLGRLYVPGLFFPDPYNSIINLILYFLASGSLAIWMKFTAFPSPEPVEKFLFRIVMLFLLSFMWFSFGNFFLLLVWFQIRHSDARKRVLYFTLPYFLLSVAMYTHDTWTGNIWQSLKTVLMFTPCLALETLFFGALLGFTSRMFPPLSKKEVLALLGISLFLSIGIVFLMSFQLYVGFFKITALEYFTTITLDNIIMFSIGVIYAAPVAFWVMWALYLVWLKQKHFLADYLQRYHRLFSAVVEFAKGINFNRSYYLFWKFLAIPFLIALAHSIYYHFFPWLGPFRGTSREWLIMIVDPVITLNIAILVASGLLLFLITFEYIFIPDAIKSIKAQVPRFISRPVYKAVVVLLLLFIAWLCQHALMVYTIQFLSILGNGTVDSYVDLLGSFFYAFSHMTGYDLTDYKPVDLPVRLYTVLIVLTGISLLIIFLGTALSGQDKEAEEAHPKRRIFYAGLQSQSRRNNQSDK